MGFAGELTTIGLPEVFQNLAFNRLTGVLTVSEGEQAACVYLEEGFVRALNNGTLPDYVGLAAEMLNLTPEETSGLHRRRRTLREILSARPDFDERVFDTAVGAIVKEDLVQLFLWRNASFVFEEEQPEAGLFDVEQLDCHLALDPQSVVMEAARRSDEWETIAHSIESEHDIFLRVEREGESVSDEEEQLLSLLDGSRDLERLVAELPHGRFPVMRLVAELAERGLLVRATPEQLTELARNAEKAGEIHHAAAYLEAAVLSSGGDLALRAELVRLCELAGRCPDAARELGVIAAAQEYNGDLDAALESYLHAARLVPYETTAMERVAAIQEARGDLEGYTETSLRVAETLVSNGLLEEALDIYHRVLARDEEATAVREALASVYVKLHESKKAGRELRWLARHAWEHGELDHALHYYRAVRAVDRECEEAIERIAELERRGTRRRRRTRRRISTTFALVTLFGLGAWQGTREWFARHALHDVARAALLDGPRIDAIRAYAILCTDYPLTRGAQDAEEMVRALLVAELGRIRALAQSNPDEAELLLQRLGRIPWPSSIKDLWRDSRNRMLDLLSETAARSSPPRPPSRG